MLYTVGIGGSWRFLHGKPYSLLASAFFTKKRERQRGGGGRDGEGGRKREEKEGERKGGIEGEREGRREDEGRPGRPCRSKCKKFSSRAYVGVCFSSVFTRTSICDRP